MSEREVKLVKLCKEYAGLINMLTLVAEDSVPRQVRVSDDAAYDMGERSDAVQRELAALLELPEGVVDEACVMGLDRRLDMVYWERLEQRLTLLVRAAGRTL